MCVLARRACERAVILTTTVQYGLNDFGLETLAGTDSPVALVEITDKKDQDNFKLDALERETIAAAMAKVDGNISHAAKLLGVSRAALYRKLERYGL